MDKITWRKTLIALLVIKIISLFITKIGGINEVINTVSEIASFIVLFIFLIYLGTLIKNDYIRKNYFYCVGSTMGLLAILNISEVISCMFDLGVISSQFIDLVNFITLNIIVITIFKIAREVKKTNEINGCLLYVLAMFLLLMTFILAAIFFFFV